MTPQSSSSSSRSWARRGNPRRGYDPEDRQRRALEAQAAAAEASREVLERAAARRDAVWRDAAESNARRVGIVLGAPFAVAVVVAVLGVLLPVLFAVGGVLLLGWGVIALLTWRSATTGGYLKIDGVSPEVAIEKGLVRALAGERYEDVAESLCLALGLPLPSLRVLVDPAPNCIAAGGHHGPATIVLTTGLLAELERIELEGVLAHELAHVKRGDTLSAGVSAALLHGGRVPLPGAKRLAAWLEGPDREMATDLAAVAVTRYPPGLADAVAKIEAAESVTPRSVGAGTLGDTGSQWLAPLSGPTAAVDAAAGLFDLSTRLDVLREL